MSFYLQLAAFVFLLLVIANQLKRLFTGQKSHSKDVVTIKYIDPMVVNDFTSSTNGDLTLGQEIKIIDVRVLSEFQRGHLPNAVNICVSAPDFNSKIRRISKNRAYILCAERDSRSQKAANIMFNLGFKDIYVMTGGMIEWKILDLPLVKGDQGQQTGSLADLIE